MLNWSSLPKPIVCLSPMADMTDSAFCQVVREVTEEKGQKNDHLIVFREMVSAEAVVRGNEKTLDMTDIHPAERPLVQQIFGSDPATMAAAAQKIEAEHHPEGFDINMGCPVYKIVHNFNGCALMKDPVVAAQIVKEMKKVITVPLSVKIRLGWSDPTDCLTFVEVLEDAGADLITIHGRTKAQGYSGVADWRMVGEARKRVKSIPVLVNGDIHKPELVQEALVQSGADGVLIARGALGNPWFFAHQQEIASGKSPSPISLEERVRVVGRHLDLHLEQYGEKAVSTFRKHLSWYFKGIPNFKPYKEPMMTAKTSEELRSILTQLLP
ncbi:tRNA-dihydrouridine synthase [bacterium]|nr:tRNA-dihydrouridine synthase [bacterium]NBX49623.1 tRNA-dihydrouridine synthase [bacterium]